MAGIRIQRADVSRLVTKTTLPPDGFWFPVLPTTISVEPSAKWDVKDLVGVGDVPSPGGRGLTSVRFESIFPHIYTGMCRGLPGVGYFHHPNALITYLKSLFQNNDLFFLSIDEDAGIPEREHVSGAPGAVKDFELSGVFRDAPMRITKFSWLMGSEMYVPYTIEMEGTQSLSHLRKSIYSAIPHYIGGLKVAKGKSGKPLPRLASLGPAPDDLRRFTTRWLGANRINAWQLIAKFNGCTLHGVSVQGLSLDPVVQRKPRGQRLNKIAFPPQIRTPA